MPNMMLSKNLLWNYRKSVNNYAQTALKSALLINGGAAGALLAFIGNIWDKGANQAAVGSLTNSIFWFSFGVLLAAIGTGTAYGTLYCYAYKRKHWGFGLHVFTFLLVFSSYVFFGLGAHEAYSTFTKHLTAKTLISP